MDKSSENRELYKFEDFTIENYHQLIKLAKQQDFVFSSFSDIFDHNKKHILWRHDVEFSPFIALQMAKIEASEGVISTYFFQLHSEFYNVLEKGISEIVYEIKELGHEIGLHFDSHYYKIKEEVELRKYLMLDANYFSTVFKININTFSFHNTTEFVLSCNEIQYADLINVYSGYFKDNFSYCADSTGFWRYEQLQDVLKNPDIKWLQVLTHDAMWNNTILSPRQRVFDSIDHNAQRQKNYYDNALHEFGAKNIDWDTIYL